MVIKILNVKESTSNLRKNLEKVRNLKKRIYETFDESRQLKDRKESFARSYKRTVRLSNYTVRFTNKLNIIRFTVLQSYARSVEFSFTLARGYY